ncbi:glutamyl-tRNA reductase [Solidesulfovibrio fructosivorans JJ]]|uniref:Glutamyl-tRNA reductase n=1 Tax=Solidesulfovibrio fructosivorans JJ] TaxID=596151 RepID=E1K1I8_SOLFR|nr:glutamyl-tRNA reductase [Solidesulfovibrio fructosivorans]EFL49543.1 glutamyl-tRNA reductase [Solidesulfovibrio fructosivorans JJ]]
MEHQIYLFGLNHKTAGVDVREAFALGDRPKLGELLVRGDARLREALVLSTCNRVEVVVADAPGRDVRPVVLDAWAEYCGQDQAALAPHLYEHQGLDAVEHLFCVASGLDSLVLGEPQILGQLKAAYRHAVSCNTAGVITNRLCHKAFSVAKKVRTATGIGASAVSISYAAVELAKRIFGEMAGKKAMLVGAGEMAELAALHLLNAGVSEILVANRTYARAEELAARFKGRPVAFEEFASRLPEVDIVISSTGAPHVILKARDMRGVLKARKHKPMFFIDIAVPRDIDPDVNSLDNVYLYDIDDLQEVVEENLAQRREEAARARDIIRLQVERFGEWLKSLDVKPTIVDLLQTGEDIARRELHKTLRRLGPDVSDETRRAIETLSLSISHKLLHEPIVFLKRRAREEKGDRFIDLTRRMYNLDREQTPDDAHADRKPPLGGEKTPNPDATDTSE